MTWWRPGKSTECETHMTGRCGDSCGRHMSSSKRLMIKMMTNQESLLQDGKNISHKILYQGSTLKMSQHKACNYSYIYILYPKTVTAYSIDFPITLSIWWRPLTVGTSIIIQSNSILLNKMIDLHSGAGWPESHIQGACMHAIDAFVKNVIVYAKGLRKLGIIFFWVKL